IPDLDSLDGVFEGSFQDASADGPEYKAEYPALKVLAVAHDDDVDVGRAIGPTREGVSVARSASPYIGVGRRQDDAVGVRPVVVQAFPDAPRAFCNVGLQGAELMHLEILLGGITKEFGATSPEVCEASYVLLGRQGGCPMEVNRRHLWLQHSFDANRRTDSAARLETKKTDLPTSVWRRHPCACKGAGCPGIQLKTAFALRTSRLLPFRLISSTPAWCGVERTTRCPGASTETMRIGVPASPCASVVTTLNPSGSTV